MVPHYASEHAAGADLKSSVEMIIPPGKYSLVPTGIRLEIPYGMEGQVRPRSGLALRYGVTVLNSPGTIDSDYRGEIKVMLINHGTEPFHIAPGDRIAQIIFANVLKCSFSGVDDLRVSTRGSGGFGSTG